MTRIPYTVERRPETGMNNPTLGVWLFLASEVMLFGGLFSAYFMLRAGAETWPAARSVLSLGTGSLNTVVLLLASGAFAFALRAARAGAVGTARTYLALSILLSLAFLGIKYSEWTHEIGLGLLPRTNTFLALYYLLTGVHALHVAGGLVFSLWLWAGLPRAWRSDSRHAVVRLESAILYWYFVDAVWLMIFVLLYVA